LAGLDATVSSDLDPLARLDNCGLDNFDRNVLAIESAKNEAASGIPKRRLSNDGRATKGFAVKSEASEALCAVFDECRPKVVGSVVNVHDA
jgi:hypothetical protein